MNLSIYQDITIGLRKKSIVLLPFLLVLIPILNFIESLVAILVYGVDLPVYDEWRNYANNQGALYYIFKPVNDTYSPVGFFLEFLVQKYLMGNGIAHRFLSMLIIAGGFLVVQWKLLGLVFKNILLKSACFSFCVFIFQTGGYWGEESGNGYIQAIPLLSCLWIIYIVLNEQLPKRIFTVSIIPLAFLSGLSYISGAFILLPLTFSFFIFSKLYSCNVLLSSRLKAAYLRLIAPALLTISLQIHALLILGGNHTGKSASIFSEQLWIFILGKIGRSLSLTPSRLSLVICVAVFVLVSSLALYILYNYKNTNNDQKKLYIIYISITSILACYLLMIGIARGALGIPDNPSRLQIFAAGFIRLHFFWITIFWGWIFAMLISLSKSTKNKNIIIAIISLLSIGYISQSTNFEYYQHYKKIRDNRVQVFSCLKNAYNLNLISSSCNSLPLGWENIAANSIKIEMAENMGATFVDFIKADDMSGNPILTPLFISLEKQLFNYNGVNDSNIKLVNMNHLANSLFENKGDPQISIILDPLKTANCKKIQVSIRLETAQNDTAQIFYRPKNSLAFSEINSKTVNLIMEKEQVANFILTAPEGFESSLRFDPVVSSENFKLHDIEVFCLSN